MQATMDTTALAPRDRADALRRPDGREAVLRPGDFAIYDTASPYSLLFADGIDATFFRIPRAALALPDAAVRDTSAVTIGAGHPLAGLTSQYLARLADDPRILGGGHGAAAATPTIELIRAVLAVQLGDDRLTGTRWSTPSPPG